MLRGFDVSFPTDWAGLQTRYGASFGFARCMREGEAEDPAFRPSWQAMGKLTDWVRGAYAFASPALGSDAVDDARLFWGMIAAAGPLKSSDLFVLDLEKSALTQEETNDWAERWFDEFVRLNRAAGYTHTPGVYMGQGYLMNQTGARLNERFGWLWYPRPQTAYADTWPTTFTPIVPSGAVSWAETTWGRAPDFWQSSFWWTVPGYPDHDANVYNGTLAQLMELNMAAVDLTATAISAVAKKTLTLDGVIRNKNVTDPASPVYYMSLADFLANIEDTQDADHVALTQLATDVADLRQKITGVVDYDLLASKVVEKLQTLELGFRPST